MELDLLAPKFHQIRAFSADINFFYLSLESMHFMRNPSNAKFEQRDGHGKLRNCHGKVMETSVKALIMIGLDLSLSLVLVSECGSLVQSPHLRLTLSKC